MHKLDIVTLAGEFSDKSSLNYYTPETWEELGDGTIRLYDRPLISVARADDPIFLDFKRSTVIGRHFRLPEEWLESARSVISVFSPQSSRVRRSNATIGLPSIEWTIARIEGQRYIEALAVHLRDAIISSGAKAVAPTLEDEFQSNPSLKNDPGEIPRFNSNWSERHIAYASGLGTFGLHTNIITEKGTAGRLCSIVTDLELPQDCDAGSRKSLYANCIRCDACITRCPPRAITAGGKNVAVCSEYVAEIYPHTKPRMGCGKCQIAIPCEFKNPKG